MWLLWKQCMFPLGILHCWSLLICSLTMQLGAPYWSDPEEGGKARWQLAGVVALTLGTTGVRSVVYMGCTTFAA